MTEREELRKYMDFMYNPENAHKCAQCPNNEHKQGKRLPCGQDHCWVIAHCYQAEGRKLEA